MKNKIIGLLFAGVLLLGYVSPAFAATQAEIDAVKQQIATLQAQLNQMLTGQTASSTGWCHTFNVNLGYANSGTDEVSYLHAALKKESISYSSDGTNSYTKATGNAVVKFQSKYGITATGFVGPITRAKLNQLYGCYGDGTDSNNLSSSFSLVYPNGGQILYIGDTARITWATTGFTTSDKVDITAYTSTDPYVNVKTIASSISAIQGYYDWKISASTLPSTSYPVNLRIKIAVKNKDVSVSSASDITVNSVANQTGTLSITYPNGGQNIQVGDALRITWTTTGLSSSDKVTISALSPSSSSSSTKIIASSIPATQGYYDWDVSANTLPSATYPVTLKIKIDVAGKNISTSSASNITVNSTVNQVPAGISIVYPNGGEIITVGDTPRITWNTSGFSSSDKVKITAYMPSNAYLNVQTITSSVSATQGYYDWKITKYNLPSTQYPVYLRIKIESLSKNISAFSLSDFTVVAPPTAN